MKINARSPGYVMLSSDYSKVCAVVKPYISVNSHR